MVSDSIRDPSLGHKEAPGFAPKVRLIGHF